MADVNLGSTAQVGSPTAAQTVPAVGSSAGQTGSDGTKFDPEQVKNLETLVGRQGEELGEYRKFFQDVAPLLDKLDKSPDLVQAIINGSLTSELAKAAMEGKVTVGEAKVVAQAHTEVKKELGKEGYKAASAEDIERLVENKVASVRTDFENKIKESDELRNFESSVNDFISRTPDFKDYAEAVDKWLDEHDVTDISVAYYAVKGELSEKEAKKAAEIGSAEHQKNLVAHPGGTTGRGSRIAPDSPMVDQLIGSKSNPNVF